MDDHRILSAKRHRGQPTVFVTYNTLLAMTLAGVCVKMTDLINLTPFLIHLSLTNRHCRGLPTLEAVSETEKRLTDSPIFSTHPPFYFPIPPSPPNKTPPLPAGNTLHLKRSRRWCSRDKLSFGQFLLHMPLSALDAILDLFRQTEGLGLGALSPLDRRRTIVGIHHLHRARAQRGQQGLG